MKSIAQPFFMLAGLLLAMLVFSCMGPEGPQGPQGPGGMDYPYDGSLTYTISGTTAGGQPFNDTVTLKNYLVSTLTSTMIPGPGQTGFRLMGNDSTLYMNRLVLNFTTTPAPVFSVVNAVSSLAYRQPFANKWLEFNQTTAGDTTTHITRFVYDPATHRAVGDFTIHSQRNSTTKPAIITGSFDVYITEMY